MKHVNTGASRAKFDVLLRSRDLQAAMMTLRPGAASDEELSNEHAGSEQWLFVISGAGEAIVKKPGERTRRVPIRENSLLLIEKHELHQINNTGRRPLRTLNFYSPPAYDENGEPLEAT